MKIEAKNEDGSLVPMGRLTIRVNQALEAARERHNQQCSEMLVSPDMWMHMRRELAGKLLSQEVLDGRAQPTFMGLPVRKIEGLDVECMLL